MFLGKPTSWNSGEVVHSCLALRSFRTGYTGRTGCKDFGIVEGDWVQAGHWDCVAAYKADSAGAYSFQDERSGYPWEEDSMAAFGPGEVLPDILWKELAAHPSVGVSPVARIEVAAADWRRTVVPVEGSGEWVEIRDEAFQVFRGLKAIQFAEAFQLQGVRADCQARDRFGSAFLLAKNQREDCSRLARSQPSAAEIHGYLVPSLGHQGLISTPLQLEDFLASDDWQRHHFRVVLDQIVEHSLARHPTHVLVRAFVVALAYPRLLAVAAEKEFLGLAHYRSHPG